MKNYNKILEAVNRGILLALDDFDDEEQVLHVKSRLINHRDYTKDYLDLMKEVVDLGLPSGTLWCKYNLGVDLNLLSKPEDWYGGYYAWGELKGNKIDEKGNNYFNWHNYKFVTVYNTELARYFKLIKYCNDPKNGLNRFTDNLIELLPEDDVAYQNKLIGNYKFHMPSKELCEELINCTKNYWVKNYDPNKIKHNPEDDGGIKGLNGRVFEGLNENLLFIPAAGYRYEYQTNLVGSRCKLWSSRLDDYPFNVYGLSFNSYKISVRDNDRCYGCSVRPVINL